MSKKKKIIAVLAILLAILVSFLGGQTFSKYITEVVGKANAHIANWHFLVNEQEATTQTINLASTVNNGTLIDNKVAPGTSGKFIITVDGTGSDVGILYQLSVENETTKPHNLHFTYKGQRYEEIERIANAVTGIINANDTNKTRKIEIEWEWPYEIGGSVNEIAENDKQDMEDLEFGNYSFDLIVTGTQVAPRENAEI